MFRTRQHLICSALAGTILIAAPSLVVAEDAKSPMTRAEVETIVRDYLLNNPEILVEVSQALSEKQRAQAQADLFGNPDDPFLGNPDGTMVVAEFFDYNCGYCRKAYSEAQTAIEGNPDLKIVLKEYPILGPDSQAAHIVAAALNRIAPEKYAEFHSKMFTTEGRATEDKALETAIDLGIDEAALRTAMAERETLEYLEKTEKLGLGLQVNGTPTYFDKSGPFGFDQLVSRTLPENASDG
ncbi:DsbA family protein [Notoacmeibacter sp. MSK16QG-6]|uniref:DsbA family protein n=1 Tax=Notoacmeibacter sp. MSK16QG-6 TaxID=2957982 RepID=UPI00209FFA3D|nr:DsbA family protein [Notoacmeibacter sp. MSK16QG-6]MCP1197849.1 DsbA family protein [Notoacmeibacter sp. MSK16QG-6]